MTQAKVFPVVVLVGPRQVGKTSLLERVFTEHRFVPFDVRAHAEMAETRPEDFLARYPPPLLLDEVQYAPAFFRHIKTTVDAQRDARGLFVLTGSQNFTLMASVADSLAGRAAVIPFHSLSAAEWRAGMPMGAGDETEFLWRGGFPALWAHEAEPDAPGPTRDRWYQGYLATYLERDVRSLLRVGSLRDFERFLRAAAARVSQLLNLSDLARDVGISVPTAKEWLSVLQASGQVFLLEPYHRSLGKRLTKSPKLYFCDTGLAAFLSGFQSAAALWHSQRAGAFLECFVVAQALRWRDWQAPSAGLWFFRDQGGHEVDLLIEMDGQLHPIEVKLSERPTVRDFRSYNRLVKLYGDDAVAPGILACTTPSPYAVSPRITAKSAWDFADLLC
ncbi:MAG: ATP-binding protein [Polyangiales bacterium]